MPRPWRMLRRPEEAGRRLARLLARAGWFVPGWFVLLAGCRAPEAERTAAVPPAAVARGDFAGLQAALAAGDDPRAAQLVNELARRELARDEAAQVEAARSVLRGRELVASLGLELASEEVSARPGLFELVLRVENRSSAALTLALPPADLKRHRATIDVRGAEGLEFDSLQCTVLSELALGPGARERRVLLTYELPLGRALAVRERWALAPRSGEVRADGRRYPAAGVVVAGCARERVSPLLGEELAPSALAAALQAEPAPDTRLLLETALRIAPTAREAALGALSEPVAALARSAPERVRAAEPALRWLTGNRDLGGDAAAWARYLAVRAQVGAETGGERPRLDLPARRE